MEGTYPPQVEGAMRTLFRSLSEHERRLYAAVEAAKLGRGGLAYLAGVLGCDEKTIRRGAGATSTAASGTSARNAITFSIL